MRGISGGRRVAFATAVVVAAVPAGVSVAGVGGGDAPKIVSVQYYEELKDMRHAVVVDVKGEDPVVGAIANGAEYNGRLAANIHHGAGVQSFVIGNREFRRGVRDDFADDEVAKFKVFAGNDGGVVRKKCKLQLLHDPDRGSYAADRCKPL